MYLLFSFRCGSDRSSVYVALSCLVQQLKNENRADVFTVVRKLRSQRLGMVQHLVSYFDKEKKWTEMVLFCFNFCYDFHMLCVPLKKLF